MKNLLQWVFVLILAFSLSSKVFAAGRPDVTQMVNMPLEDLLNTKVTSSAGFGQKLNDVANAVYVISKEDIERSGAREVGDLLYRVPGMQIRQIDAHQYGIGIRENGVYTTNNLLVLIDGAVVFDPLVSGVVWENLPVSLNEIERIEIIRGAPGVLYSSNAVNGVINIITKSADIHDNYISQQGGTQSYRDSSIGVGGKISTTGLALRVYFDNEFDQGFPKALYRSYSDRYRSDKDGVRLDYTPSDHQRLSVIANNNQQNSISPNNVTGVETKTPGQKTSAIINYTDKVTDMYDYSFHFDHVEHLGTAFNSYDTIDHTTSATTQHNFHYDLFGSHITSVGGELRYNALHEAEDQGIHLHGLVTNGQASQKVISFFTQDEYQPIEKLILTVGVREDSNTLVINEKPLYSPKVSALYHFTPDQSVWVSSSQTYRTPCFMDHDLSITVYPKDYFYPGFPGFTFRGSTNLKPEKDLNQEVGYRGLYLDQKLKVDATFFSKDLKDLIVLDEEHGTTGNNGSLKTYGAEMTLDYQFTDNLSFFTDYTYAYPHIKPETSNTSDLLYYEVSASNNIVGIGARYTLNKLKLDLYAKYFEGYVSPDVNEQSPKIRGYYKTFMRISYDFQTPAMGKLLGKQNGTVFLNVTDPFPARQIENSTDGIFIKPEVSAGLKITF